MQPEFDTEVRGLTSHDQEAAAAQMALRDALATGEALAPDAAIAEALKQNPAISLEAVKSAVWALTRQGILDVTWDGHVRRLEGSAT
jgi:hypothetical protein